MPRTLLLALLVLAACRHDNDPPPLHPSETASASLPPLPPASGTPIGFLLDSASELKLSVDQLRQLKDIDDSLAVHNTEIDNQLRVLEKPEAGPDEGGRKNNAPGAGVKPTADGERLRNARNANTIAALKKAFALLDATQLAAARKLLEDRAVITPGNEARPQPRTGDDGAPVPLEP